MVFDAIPSTHDADTVSVMQDLIRAASVRSDMWFENMHEIRAIIVKQCNVSCDVDRLSRVPSAEALQAQSSVFTFEIWDKMRQDMNRYIRQGDLISMFNSVLRLKTPALRLRNLPTEQCKLLKLHRLRKEGAPYTRQASVAPEFRALRLGASVERIADVWPSYIQGIMTCLV